MDPKERITMMGKAHDEHVLGEARSREVTTKALAFVESLNTEFPEIVGAVMVFSCKSSEDVKTFTVQPMTIIGARMNPTTGRGIKPADCLAVAQIGIESAFKTITAEETRQ
jgi:hypothetical protein